MNGTHAVRLRSAALSAAAAAVILLAFSGCGSPSSPASPGQEAKYYDVLGVTATRGFALDMDVAGDTLYVAENYSGVGAYDIADYDEITFKRRVATDSRAELVDAVLELNALFVHITDKTQIYFLDSLTLGPGSQIGSGGVSAILTEVTRDSVQSQNWINDPQPTVEADVIRTLLVDGSSTDGLQVATVYLDSSNVIPGEKRYLFEHVFQTVLNNPTVPETGIASIEGTDVVAVGLLDYGVGIANVSPETAVDGEWLSDVDTPGEASAIVYGDGYLFVADGVAGMTVIDVSDRFAPEVVASWKIEGVDHVVNVALSQHRLAVVDQFDGVYFLDVSDPEDPEYKGAYEVREPTDAVFVENNILLVTSRLEGITALRLVF
ncbi:MAG: hypothetical protein MAG453_02151 [Calditrichaeota bacterium]|nr:hypothetical protein [Calditrichota bacterium]